MPSDFQMECVASLCASSHLDQAIGKRWTTGDEMITENRMRAKTRSEENAYIHLSPTDSNFSLPSTPARNQRARTNNWTRSKRLTANRISLSRRRFCFSNKEAMEVRLLASDQLNRAREGE